MAGWLHGVCVGACGVVSPQRGFSLSLFCNPVPSVHGLHMHVTSWPADACLPVPGHQAGLVSMHGKVSWSLGKVIPYGCEQL